MPPECVQGHAMLIGYNNQEGLLRYQLQILPKRHSSPLQSAKHFLNRVVWRFSGFKCSPNL